MFYLNDGQLWTVGIATDPRVSWEDPVALFDLPLQTSDPSFANYDVTPDGQRFVFTEPAVGEETAPLSDINVVLNWHQELLERVP